MIEQTRVMLISVNKGVVRIKGPAYVALLRTSDGEPKGVCTLEAVLRTAIWSFNGPCHCLGGVGAVDGATPTPHCARDPGWQAPTPTADRNLPCSGAWSFSYLILNPTSTPTSVRLTRYHYSDFHHARPTAPRTLRRPTPDRRYAPPKLPNTLRSRRSTPRRRDLNTCHPRTSPLST